MARAEHIEVEPNVRLHITDRLHVVFKDSIVQSIITDAGKENAEYLLLVDYRRSGSRNC
jgi:hypothetical protein